MKNHWFWKSVALLGILGAGGWFPLAAEVSGSAPSPAMAVPGTINYVEGAASVDRRALIQSQTGYVPLREGHTLSTANGKVEVLLSPGVFLREGSNSEIRMISSQLTEPQVELLRGEAMIEVDWMPKDERIGVQERGAQALILKRGLYKFDSDSGQAAVIDGKMQVSKDDEEKEFGKGKEVVLTAASLKPVGFDRDAKDDLYRWSNIRAGYLAEANVATARNYYVNGYAPYAGWYWDPYFDFWSWMPYDGYFFSPFGYPFFSPGYVVLAPRYGSGFGRFGSRGGFAGRSVPSRGAAAMAPRASGGFHGGGFGGGGFHGGGRR